jgi:hypothetical protein
MVTVDYDPNDGGECGLLTIASQDFSVQLSLIPSELAGLAGVPQTSWAERRYVQAGECMGLSAYWSSAEHPGTALLTLGADPETSAVVVLLSAAAVADLVRLAGTHAG